MERGSFILGLLCAALLAACKPSGADCTGNRALTGNIADAKTGAPVPNALVVIAQGGAQATAADPARGNPSYQYSTTTDTSGKFDIDLLCGLYTVNAYPTGYTCASAQGDVGVGASVAVTPQDPNAALPTVDSVAASDTNPPPGHSITITANVQAPDPNDPLSDQVLLVNPAVSFAAALDPPSPGSATGYPNGTYTKTLLAPTRLGPFTYTVVAATKGCLTARGSVTVSVR